MPVDSPNERITLRETLCDISEFRRLASDLNGLLAVETVRSPTERIAQHRHLPDPLSEIQHGKRPGREHTEARADWFENVG